MHGTAEDTSNKIYAFKQGHIVIGAG